MAGLLALIAVVLPCWYAYKRCVLRGRVEINHVATFTFGFLFYWITPLLVRLCAAKLDFPLASLWASWFRERLIVPYALSCVVLYICFAIGDSLGMRWFHDQPRRSLEKIPRVVLSLVSVAGCLLLAYTVFAFRAPLFRQASPTDVAAQAARGAVTACVVLLAIVCLILTIERPAETWKSRLGTGYFLSFIAGCAMMLLLGSRLYVASFLLMFAIYQSNFRQRFKLTTVVSGAVILALFFGVVGMWREQGELSGAFFNVVEEPMLSSISLVHHLRYKGISWLNTPTQLESDFLNLVPSVLLPNKIDILKKPDAYRPLGGLNSFVSFDLNFGMIGSGIFLLIWPILFRYCKSRSADSLWATIYILCSGWLAFTFFRDAFSISLVKAIVECSIVIPVALFAFSRLVAAACWPETESGPLLRGPQIEAL
ncbi:MAG: O-antigen polymerase [Candidatus Korobacteraceae bacterium]